MSDILRFYDSPLNFDTDIHTAQAETTDIINVDIDRQQNLRHVQYWISVVDLPLKINAATFAATFVNDIKRFRIDQPINFIGLSPTIRNAEFHLSLGDIYIKQLPASTGNFFPVANWVARAGQGTVLYPLPNMESYDFSYVCYPATGFTSPYEDFARVLVGFLPNNLSRIVVP